ncbi:MAG: hypothetical protein Q4B46_02165 [Comamonadaceae bacterium]|nr:hypothetical protein [Comamonadaceae bacterium]
MFDAHGCRFFQQQAAILGSRHKNAIRAKHKSIHLMHEYMHLSNSKIAPILGMWTPAVEPVSVTRTMVAVKG